MSNQKLNDMSNIEPNKQVKQSLDVNVISDKSEQSKYILIDLSEVINRCIGCNTDLGESNPRQYCGKTHCLFDDYPNVVIQSDHQNN
jgi:hypothetical protein